jgi:membrane peptidoglycan carboxypeptidase
MAPVSPSGGSAGSPGASVGRAQVRPVSPSTPPGAGGPGGRGPNGPGGRPPVPGAPLGEGPDEPGRDPAGRRPFAGFGLGDRRRNRGPGGRGPGGGPEGRKAWLKEKARKARIRNIIIASVALLIMLSGGGFVGVTLFVDSIKLGEQLPMPETSMLYYSDGTPLARLGENTRYVVPYENMSPYVIEAVIAAEDNTFWTNEGVEFTAILRAAWNNITGGHTQGGSTITQQYARIAFDLQGATYNRKIREAVLAWKMSDQLSKEDIISSYLNTVEFGRQTFGAEAAAQAFFGKSIKKDAPPEKQITRSEAMALVAMVKQPYPDPDNPEGAPGYDPTRGEEGSRMRQRAQEEAIGRWNYVKDQLLELSAQDPEHFTLTPEEAATLEFPTTWIPESEARNEDLTKPVGLIEKHVLAELVFTPGSPFQGMSYDQIRSGGYHIITTIHPGAQAAAERAADETIPESQMYGQSENMQAALVSVEPGTGRVVAYFGGHDGSGSDYAGIFRTEDGSYAGFGSHPPGSSAKVYTLAAAIRKGYSIHTYWRWTPHPQPGRDPSNPVKNASECSSDMDKETKKPKSELCSLLESTVWSLNVPFYSVAASLGGSVREGAREVLQMAYDAGIEHIWNDSGQRADIKDLGGDVERVVQDLGISLEVAIGQYRYTVLDHANGMATFAAGGLRADAHFVKEVTKNGEVLFRETLPDPNGPRIMNQAQIDVLNYTLSKVWETSIAGYQIATKTGTWEYQNGGANANAHAWNVGYTNVLAAAVWVGPKKDEEALYEKNGNPLWGSGLPRRIWEQYMREAIPAMALDGPKRFNPPNDSVGRLDPPGSFPSPTPSATPTPTATTPTPTPTRTRPSSTGSSTSTTPTSSTTSSDDEDDEP